MIAIGWEAERHEARLWFYQLRDRLCAEFEAIEAEQGEVEGGSCEPGRFQRTVWQREAGGMDGGGGEMSILRGRVLEKAGVNVSVVHGEFAPRFAAQISGAAEDPRFWAAGISVVVHPRSPLIPAAHMNTRFIVTTRAWFGGGADLTPYRSGPGSAQENEIDKTVFHDALREACDVHDVEYYPRFSAACDQYFYLPHRDEPRGAGGIFYDHLDSGVWSDDFSFTRRLGEVFLRVFPAIMRRRVVESWSEAQRTAQLIRRGRYVEFNLLHDRGTKFGLETNGNTEAILMSLPPQVSWP